jgi:hypothetical protein
MCIACVASRWWTLQPVVSWQQEATNWQPHPAATSMLRPPHNNAFAAVHRTMCIKHDSCKVICVANGRTLSQCQRVPCARAAARGWSPRHCELQCRGSTARQLHTQPASAANTLLLLVNKLKCKEISVKTSSSQGLPHHVSAATRWWGTHGGQQQHVPIEWDATTPGSCTHSPQLSLHQNKTEQVSCVGEVTSC